MNIVANFVAVLQFLYDHNHCKQCSKKERNKHPPETRPRLKYLSSESRKMLDRDVENTLICYLDRWGWSFTEFCTKINIPGWATM